MPPNLHLDISFSKHRKIKDKGRNHERSQREKIPTYRGPKIRITSDCSQKPCKQARVE